MPQTVPLAVFAYVCVCVGDPYDSSLNKLN